MIELLCNQLIVTLGVRIFAHIPLKKYFRYSVRMTVAIIAATELLWLMLFMVLLNAGIGISLTQLICIPLFGYIYFRTVKIDWGKLLFLYMFSATYSMLIRGSALFAEAVFFSEMMENVNSWRSSGIVLLLYLLTMPGMVRYLERTSRIVIETDIPEFWKRMWILPLFNVLMVLLFTYRIEDASMLNIKYIAARILLFVSMFLVYYFVLFSIRQLQQQISAQERVRYLERLTECQASQYTLLQSYIEDTKRARHDLRQHLKVMESYFKKGDSKALSAYVKGYAESIPKETPHNYCQNYAVDSILGFYIDKARLEKIQVEISFCSMKDSTISEMDLCVILGNLLENALDACSLIEDKTAVIKIRARKPGSRTFVLTIDNTCLGPPREQNGKILSAKHEGFGIGTESVRSIAEKYNGDARYEWKDGMFYASVLLNI